MKLPHLSLAMVGLCLAATAALAQPERLPPPDFADVSYGTYERQVYDLWLPRSESRAPLVLFIHGGGFRQGDKSGLSPGVLREYLAAGWAVASINYRLTDTAPAPAAYLDCARALQHLRHNAARWNLDPLLVASTGSSAGAGTSLWLAFHDDLAIPDSPDPVARQSTRLVCVAVANAQPSYDPRFAERAGIPRPNFERHPFFGPFYRIEPGEIDTAHAYARYEAAAPITYLDPADPPVLLTYNHPNEPVTAESSLSLVVHHPLLGLALKREMDALGIECIVQYRDRAGGGMVQVPAAGAEGPVRVVEFIRRHFEAARRAGGAD